MRGIQYLSAYPSTAIIDNSARRLLDRPPARAMTARGESSLRPHLVGELDDLAHLGPLLVLREDVAFLGAGEAALRAERELLDRCEFRRLVDAALDVLDLLQRAGFRRDEAEHDDLIALGQEAERLEAAGARRVVFEEIAVVFHVAQQPLGDRLVAALGDPGGTEVAAADMRGDHHVGGLAFQ